MVTLIIMETFISKMRKLRGIRKMILIEECWKALMSANMSEYIKYLFKTVRKYFGEAVVVTQEVDDIISSDIVKEAIINNSDCKILLDQRKYMNKFEHIQKLLGLTEKERGRSFPSTVRTVPDLSTVKSGSGWAEHTPPFMRRRSARRSIRCTRPRNPRSWNSMN